MEISFSARCQVGQVFSDTQPYSVTTWFTIWRVTVVMEPMSKFGTILEITEPSLLVWVEGRQMKLRPPLDQ